MTVRATAQALRLNRAANAGRSLRAQPFGSTSSRRSLSSACLAKSTSRPTCLSSPSSSAAAIFSISITTSTPSSRRFLSLWPSSLWPFYSAPSSSSPPPQAAATPAPPTTLDTAPPAPTLNTAPPPAPTPNIAPPQPTPDPASAASASAPASSSVSSAATTTTAPPLDPNPEVAAILSEFQRDPLAAAGTPDALLADSILDMPERIGYLHSLGIDFGWGTSSTMMWFLEHVHIYSGMPWWGSIVATAALIRIAMVPFVIRQNEATRKMTDLSRDPQFKMLQDRFMQLVKSGEAATNRSEFATLRGMTVDMRNKAGVRMVDMYIPLAIQIPLGFSMWRIIRTMSDLPVPGLETGGILWFTDLAAQDPYYILPLVNPLVLYALMHANSSLQTEQQKAMAMRGFYFMAPMGALVMCWMPSSLQLYFISTLAFTAAQTYSLRSARVRSLIGLPPLSPPVATPALNYQPARISDPNKGMVQNIVDSVNQSLPWTESVEATREKKRKMTEKTEEQRAEDRQLRERRERYEKAFRK